MLVAFTKIFNLVFPANIIRREWFKGIISPIGENDKGSQSKPDNHWE